MSVFLSFPALTEDSLIVVCAKFSFQFFEERIAGVTRGFKTARMSRRPGFFSADVTMAIHRVGTPFDGHLEGFRFGEFFGQLFATCVNVIPNRLVGFEIFEMNDDSSVVRHALIPPVANVPQSTLADRWTAVAARDGNRTRLERGDTLHTRFEVEAGHQPRKPRRPQGYEKRSLYASFTR